MPTTRKDPNKDFQKLIAKLENMILIGAFQPRERLVEINLAEKLGVSRAWIRDALRVLETKSLIEVVPFKGATVRELDEREINEIFQIRVVLESLSNRLACARFTENDARVLKRLAKQIKDSFECQDFEEMVSANNQFHSYLRELSGNKSLVDMLDQLRARFHIFNTFAWSRPGIAQKLVEEHEIFIKALEDKNLELIDEISTRHYSYSKDLYLLQLKTQKAIASAGNDS
ncbi:MAG: GntR family transcriptional regulator [Desulfarculaceae bacterium]|jgi:DNA-binding GntR family transcriptional regulator